MQAELRNCFVCLSARLSVSCMRHIGLIVLEYKFIYITYKHNVDDINRQTLSSVCPIAANTHLIVVFQAILVLLPLTPPNVA